MQIREAQSLIEDVLGNSFNRDRFSRLARNLFRDFDEEKLWNRHGQYIKEAYRDYIKSYELIGRTELDDKKLSVLVVNLKSGKKIDGARTAMRNFVSNYLDDKDKNAALTAFISEDNLSDWRFSFIRLEKELAITENGKVKPKSILTPASRFSFLVGENEPHHTASQQLSHLLQGGVNSLEDIEKAFDVEVVTESFFNDYKKLYERVKETLKGVVDHSIKANEEFNRKKISQEHFALKLLSQIVFLYFVQKKGWLGVPKNAKWGEGDKHYLTNSLIKTQDNNQVFFCDILEPLFYEALAIERDDCYYENFDCRIPFLNGGLFEPINGYSWDMVNLELPNSLFKEIFGVFDRYNFTVRENEPLDKEVAVDPEMLGKVFESLISYRNDTGAFYTPSVIVHFISSYTLKRYITNLVKDINRNELDDFFEKCDSSVELDSKRAEKEQDTNVHSWKTPESIRKNAKEIDFALSMVKVCDPAVGSGAFLIGIMQEVVRLRRTLAIHLGRFSDNMMYEIKRSCIKNSLHGIDIDPTAVDIAKLRLWLSLIVDEDRYDVIEPLPNLDYNIMQGNSVISKADGINLDGEMEIGLLFEDERFADLECAKAEYFDATHFMDKKSKRDKVDAAIQNILLTKNHEAIRKIDLEVENLRKAWANNSKKLREALEPLEKKRNTLQQQTEELSRIIKDASGNRNFFPWRLYFAEIFSDGGFDCVVGNPPYIQLQSIKEQTNLLKDMNYHSYNQMGDIYCLFYELGCNLLKKHGILSYITSNKWMRAGYGKELREYFVSRMNPLCLIDFAGQKVFNSATVDVNIITLEKDSNKGQTESCVVKDRSLNSLSVYIKQNGVSKYFNSSDSWTILSPIEESIKQKIEAIGKPLKDWDVQINYGIKTGFNEAFIINRAKRDEIIAADPKSAEIIRPILRGRDIKRYDYNFADQWLIATFPSRNYDIERYPAVKKHLLSFGMERLEQTGKEYSINGQEVKARKKTKNEWFETQDSISYWDDFSKQKIVWGEISDKTKFAFDENGEYVPEATTFLMTGVSLKYLLGFLNSRFSEYFFSKIATTTGVGTVRWKKYKIEQLQIPELSIDEQKPFVEIVDKIINTKKNTLNTSDIEHSLNEMIYHLIGFSKSEIKIIENG